MDLCGCGWDFNDSGAWVPGGLWRAAMSCGDLWCPVADHSRPLYNTMLGPWGWQNGGWLEGWIAGWLLSVRIRHPFQLCTQTGAADASIDYMVCVHLVAFQKEVTEAQLPET